MKKISIYCFILISLGFIGCTSKTHEKTIEDFDIREMSLQVHRQVVMQEFLNEFMLEWEGKM